MIKMPTEQQSLDWALHESEQYPNNPTSTRLHLLVLVHLIKRLSMELLSAHANRLTTDNIQPPLEHKING